MPSQQNRKKRPSYTGRRLHMNKTFDINFQCETAATKKNEAAKKSSFRRFREVAFSYLPSDDDGSRHK